MMAGTFLAITCLPAAKARELFQSSTDLGTLLVSIKHFFYLGFSVGDVISMGV